VTLKCLTEIGSLSVGAAYDEQFRYLFGGVVRQLTTFLPLEMSMAFFFFFFFFSLSLQ